MSATTVTRRCEGCGELFALTRAEALNVGSPPRCCGPRCRAAVRRAKLGPCDACGQGPGPTAAFRLRLCVPCRNIAHGTCWRKWQADSEAEALDVRPGAQFHAYRCELCGYWHRTTAEGPVDLDAARRLGLLVALFRRTGFSINAARGGPRRWVGFSRRADTEATEHRKGTQQ